MQQEFFEFVQKLNGCPDADAIWQLLNQFCANTPFDNINFVHTHNDDFFAIGDGPQDYLKHYNEDGYASDDHLLRALLTSESPIIGGRAFMDILPCKSERELKVMMDAREAGMSVDNVLAVPVLQGGRRSVMSALSDTNRPEFETYLNVNGGWLISTLLYAQMKLVDLTTDSPGEHPLPQLTARQMEVLKWMSQGLRNDQIAEKMMISYDGVSYHLKGIRKKLGVNNRAEILPKALKAGVIRL